MKEEPASAVRWIRSHILSPHLTPWGPPVSRVASAVCSVCMNVNQATQKGFIYIRSSHIFGTWDGRCWPGSICIFYLTLRGE